jgi:integrase
MLNFNAILEEEYKSAYESAYDLPLKKQFSNPKIYTAKGDLSKRWYVYFSYRNPSTGKLTRQTPFYGNVNTFKTKEERMLALSIYRTTIQKYLKQGYSPYEDNSERHNEQAPSSSVETVETRECGPQIQVDLAPIEVDMGMTISEAIEFDLAIKKKTLRDSSIRSYKSHINVFRAWLDKNHPDVRYMVEVDKKLVFEFLNHILQDTSARNRNNYRASLSSLFQCLEDNDIVAVNFIGKIKVLNSAPRRNKTYSLELQEEIFEYLKETDPLLLLYIKFVSYNFLRPIEVCRLKVGDIDIKTRTLSFVAKNSPMKTKIIPDILLMELPDLSTFDQESSLFTPEGMGKHWDIKLESKRGYFTKRFGKTVKKKFGLDLDHTLYSFRHTFITKLYRQMSKQASPFEAKSKLMQITGHTSMKALEKYLRDIDAQLPEDYSEMLRN